MDLDSVDRGLIHALHLDGRAPFRTIAEVLEVSENTVARRYRRLRSAGLLRVVGTVNGARLGYTPWTVRLRCTPDAAAAVADALAARDDTSWVYLLSGGTEVSCNVQTRSSEDQDALLLHKLPRTRRLVSVSAHLLLGSYALPTTWPGVAHLSPDQVERLQPPQPAPGDSPITLDDGDRALLDALSRDGRAPYSDLTSATGWSESTVRRRMESLRSNGVLHYQVDIPPAVLGFTSQARLWITARPSQVVPTAKALADHPEVSFAALTTGPTNLLAAVNCRDTADLARYLTERVSALDAIREMETAPIIRTVKRAGALLPFSLPFSGA
ncbi:Lrp/AsnC family transcriptional regulator [Actinomadura barringtoniae]|uniref:Lrp/AsnC family transcriptional regulator n=1 Tax=Actinomadura barringtoniae TaxID=1427535 RepID=A0A939PF33_9ACTN|nr:Lrp/AsnC family transcriptional regulator [Actinomadura barringtoniae]MBO2451677.1 Lrp/AsnC family transcriptional regulator [Actinomadura barringtoniae]